MPRYRHPRTFGVEDPAQFAVDVGDGRPVTDADGVFETGDERTVRAIAQAHDTTVDEMRERARGLNQQTGDADPEALVNDGVCPWCDEYEGGHVGQHASSAHPEEWDAYQGGED